MDYTSATLRRCAFGLRDWMPEDTADSLERDIDAHADAWEAQLRDAMAGWNGAERETDALRKRLEEAERENLGLLDAAAKAVERSEALERARDGRLWKEYEELQRNAAGCVPSFAEYKAAVLIGEET